MGRYYSGDIEGKFWFGVQDSTDADFFGKEHYEPSYVEYCYEEDDIPEVKKGLAKCKKELGPWKQKLETFFKQNNGYNDEMLKEQLGLDKIKAQKLLEWYAREILGQKILKCLKKNGECNFTAEL